jgi:hypothetical protein
MTRRVVRSALGTATVVVVAGGALAYFSGSGAGTGSAGVGTSSTLTIHGTTGGSLYPGASTTVSFTVDNPSTGHERAGTIHLSSIVACNVAFVSEACPSGHEVSSCESAETGSSDGNTANYWMPDVVSNQDVASGSGQALTATGTLTMNNLSTSQDACKSVNLLLNLTS